jgi:uroporphyrin-III C-methyltransferase
MTERRIGKVFLVGAGPGDPELLTLKAVRAIGVADVILVDALVDRRVLAHARGDARVIEVGKRGGCRSTPQQFIERLMVRFARAGAIVARVKGGDPFVFGRGGEEAVALARAGVRFEVVPGVSAGLAAPASAGIPVTHRGIARGVTFVSGHTSGGGDPDWRALARSNTTLVIFMGVAALESMVARLMEAGLDSSTPVAAIERATWADQRVLRGTLSQIVAIAKQVELKSPAIVVVGEVVALADVIAKEAPWNSPSSRSNISTGSRAA